MSKLDSYDTVIVAIFLAICVIILGLIVVQAGEKQDLKYCKQTYGEDYVLWHSTANSAVKACKSPDGSLKELR